VRRGIKITIVISLLFISVFFPVRGYALNSAREITYKNVNTVLTKEDIDLTGGNYVFSGLTDTLPYTVTEDDLGTNDLTIYDGQEMRTIKIVVTEASREVDRDGWTKIEASEDTRIVYVSSSEGDDNFGMAHKASDIKVNYPDDIPAEGLIKVANSVMEGYDSPSGVVSASSENTESGYKAWKAFTRSPRDELWSTDNKSSGWIQYEFDSETVVAQYIITAHDRSGVARSTMQNQVAGMSPRDWTFEASNDGENWNTLHTVTGETGWSTAERRV